jgi:CheY-like chemotaxis protein
MQFKPIVTIINNEPTFRWTVTRLLEGSGYAVITHERNTAAVDKVRETRPAAIILEASSGSAVTAMWIVERLRGNPETRYYPIIVCSPDGKFLHSYGEYLRGQGCVVLGRPYNDEKLIELLQNVVAVQNPFPQPALDELGMTGS